MHDIPDFRLSALPYAGMRRRLGFTLVELVVAMAIAGIVVAMAVPGFTQMLNNNRAVSFANELAAVLNYARSEAIKRGVPVSVCTYDTTTLGSASITQAFAGGAVNCAGDNAWQNGWLVFVDPAGTGTTVSSLANLLKTGQPSNTAVAVVSVGTFVNYQPLGNSPNGGQISICVGAVAGEAVGTAETLTVNASGRINFVRGTC